MGEAVSHTGVQEARKAAERLRPWLGRPEPADPLMDAVRSMSELQFAPDPLADAVLTVPPHFAGSAGRRQAWDWDHMDYLTLLAASSIAVVFNAILARRNTTDMCFNVMSLALMLFVSAVYILAVRATRGQADAEAWLAGYVLESALSVDDLFVFHLVFTAFAVPSEQAHGALTAGIYAGIFFRIVFIVFFSALFQVSYAVNIVVGCLLIVGAVLTLVGSGSGPEHVQNLYAVRFFKWLLGARLKDQYDEHGYAFTYGKNGLQCNVLFLVVCILIVVDVFSAVDAVGSKTKELNDTYLNMSSSFMTMFTLRPLFFVIRGMAEHYDMVKYGISAILVFVGVQMIVMKWFPLPLGWLAMVIIVILASSVLLSIACCWLRGGRGRRAGGGRHRRHPRKGEEGLPPEQEWAPEDTRTTTWKDGASPI